MQSEMYLKPKGNKYRFCVMLTVTALQDIGARFREGMLKQMAADKLMLLRQSWMQTVLVLKLNNLFTFMLRLSQHMYVFVYC